MSYAFGISRSRKIILACSLLVSTLGAQHAQASSDDAWEEFQQDVQNACLAASQGLLQVMSVKVDPYGSESYGFAVLFGFEKGNPIEQVFAKLKHLIRNAAPRTVEATWRKAGELLDTFSPAECANYLRNSGYASE